MVVVLSSLQSIPTPIPPHTLSSSSSSSNNNNSSDSHKIFLTRRRTVLFTASVLASYLQLNQTPKPSSSQYAIAQQQDELDRDEDRLVNLFQDTSSSVVFIKDLQLVKSPKSSDGAMLIEDENVKVEGTGSGFIWDKFGHIVSLADAKGNSFSKEATIVGFDPAYDIAVLKASDSCWKVSAREGGCEPKSYIKWVELGRDLCYWTLLFFPSTMSNVMTWVVVEGNELKPVILGTSRDLHVGQSCFAIGNPYGYENTLTTGVVSGLGREIPSPNGQAIRGAIQTDAAINSGRSRETLLAFPKS
ncbi:DEGP protease 5 [Actinidia rufa]|uniref:DEGP protease 5 n=1 Tax=Actinidia rufa TaxID=165716 RepID=A0A7J0D9F1_9ERIC|nr:DEGP protease 5 [Actinidia rufa]